MGVERLYEDDPSKKLNLPYDVPANEFMNMEGHLTMAMPETRDTDWLWDGFLHRNNDELVATWGNLVNRTLTFAYRRFDGQAPTPGPLEDVDTPRGSRHDHLRGAQGHRLAQGALCSLPALFVRAAAPISGLRRNTVRATVHGHL